jgi:Flp pilus assembly protein TadD
VPLYQKELSSYCESLAHWLAICPDGQPENGKHIIALASEAIKRKPEDASLWAAQGHACYRMGDWDGAIAALGKSIELRSGDTSVEAFALSMAFARKGDMEQARRWFDRAVQSMGKHNPRDEGLIRIRAKTADLLGVKEPLKPSLKAKEGTPSKD